MQPDVFARQAGLVFSDPGLLRRALTHRSYINEHPGVPEDNERLEFLGDAALDLLSAAWLYRRFPEMDEGELTRLRSVLVRTEQLAHFAHHRCLQTAEGKVPGIFQPGAWKFKRPRVSVYAGFLDRRSSWVAQPDQARHLIEGFPGRIVQGRTQAFVAQMVFH